MFELPPWLLVIPVVGFLVFIHELGHFATAKWFGVKVTEFGFGFPPRLVGVPYRGTIYSLNLIPFGGFVRFVGEEDPTDQDSFARHTVGKRAIVIVSGPLVNLVLPVIIFTVLFMLPHDTLVSGDVVITGVVPGSPADQAGLAPGDTILSVNNHQVVDQNELVKLVKANVEMPIELSVRKGSAVGGQSSSHEYMFIESVQLVPRRNPPILKVVEEVTGPGAVKDASSRNLVLNDQGKFSFELGSTESPKYSYGEAEISRTAAHRYDSTLEVGDNLVQGPTGIMVNISNARFAKTTDPVWRAVPKSFIMIWNILAFTKDGIIGGLLSGSNPGVVGPIGIAQATGEGVSQFGFAWIFLFAALISISLGILNILPIPALDGGRLAFVLLEWIRGGKRISPRREGLVHLVGFFVLIGFVAFMSYFDIIRLLNGESFMR